VRTYVCLLFVNGLIRVTPKAVRTYVRHDRKPVCIAKTRPVSASTDLKELLNTILEIAANSDKAIDNMVQFHEAVVSVMFSNCVRSFHWLETSLNQVTCPELNARLSIIHFYRRGNVLAASFITIMLVNQ
jgi:predicted transcriptional regulator